MKTKLLYIVLFISTLAYSQEPFKIVEQNMPYNHYATSFTTDIVGLNEGFVIYHWQKFIQNHGGTTFLQQKEHGDWQFVSEHVKFPPLNDQAVTIYTRFNLDESETGVNMTIWVKLNDGNYFSSTNNQNKDVQKLKDWLYKFKQLLEKENENIIEHE